MAKAGARPGRMRRGARALARILSRLALVAIGVCVGVVVGSVWNVPELLLARLREPVATVELRAQPSTPDADTLSGFRGLQTPAASAAVAPPQPHTPPLAKAGPPVANAGPSRTEARRTPPAVSAPLASPRTRARAAEAPAPATDAARAVIADIAARRPDADRPFAERVVQVAATPDRGSATALVERLRALGFASFISGTRPSGTARYRVRVRPQGDEPIAALVARLKGRGFSVWITTE